MENRRYQISSRSKILASTYRSRFRIQSEKSIIVETRAINVSPQIVKNPRKIFTMFDSETETVSLYTSPDENLDHPAAIIRLSTRRIGPEIGRQFPNAMLLTLATCSSAETVFLAGDKPPEESRTYLFFLPKHSPEKVTKNRILWLESLAPTEEDSVSGLRTTRCFVKKMKKLVSGTVLKINRVGKIGVADIVDYVNEGGTKFKIRKGFADNLEKLTRPLPVIVKGLIRFENSRSTYNKDYLHDGFSKYVKETPSAFLWSMLQWSACLGVEDLMDQISQELATRVNKKIRKGIAAVQTEIGVGA